MLVVEPGCWDGGYEELSGCGRGGVVVSMDLGEGVRGREDDIPAIHSFSVQLNKTRAQDTDTRQTTKP